MKGRKAVRSGKWMCMCLLDKTTKDGSSQSSELYTLGRFTGVYFGKERSPSKDSSQALEDGQL